jgi:hypothetical protein
MVTSSPLARARCTARSKGTGERCKQSAIAGGTVCRFHGGGAPSVKRKAALRLAQLVDPAIATLGREMVKAEKSSDRQRAANSILDRAGITRGQSSELDVARALLLERLLEARSAPRPALGASVADPLEIVAEVVDDDAPTPKPAPRRRAPRKPATKRTDHDR